MTDLDTSMLREYTAPPHLRNSIGPSTRLFRWWDLSIIMSTDIIGQIHQPPFTEPVYDRRIHISISCEGRDPTWEEIKAIQNHLAPNVFFCMPMPPRDYWMSVHEHAYHVWELRDFNLIEQWKYDGTEAKKL